MPARPTNVLHVLAKDDWGGTEVQVTELVRRATGELCSHAVAVLEPSGELHRRLQSDGFRAFPLDGGGFLRSASRLAHVLRRDHWDVIEAYGFRAAMVTRLARRVVRSYARLVVGVRGLHIAEGTDPSDLRTRLVLRTERALSGGTSAYDANSNGARDFLVAAGFPARKFVVIPNGLEPVRAEPPAPRALAMPVRVLCVARFVPRKRQIVLVEAMRLLAEQGVDIRCEFIGDGECLAITKARAAEHGLAAHVTFSGRLPNEEVRARLYEGADLFVLCSLWEGQPGSVLEAMSAGVPVIATRATGTDEVIEDVRTGLLVTPDDPSALAAAVTKLIEDEALRARISESAWRHVAAKHSWDRLVSNKDRFFRAIADGEGP